MSIIDRATILKFHQDRIDEFGDGHTRSLGWSTEENQMARFEALAQLGNLSGKSVLDVGCGHGDLLPFLRQKYSDLDYIGIDHFSNFLDVASQRYGDQPDTRFMLGDFWQAALPATDYIIACGALSYRHSASGFLWKMIEKLYANANIAFGFTLLRSVKQEGILVAHQPEEVRDFCQSLCSNVELKLDYHQQDFAVFMYQSEQKNQEISTR